MTTCALDETTGIITRLQVNPEAENVIWITRQGSALWVANERYLKPGEISAFAMDEAGVCSRIGLGQSSHGGAICHIAVSQNGGIAVVSSYLGGISVHRIGSDGAVSAACQIINYQGSGPDVGRQEKPHPHQAVFSPDGRHLLVCDLGADKIWIHKIDDDRLAPARGIPMQPGSGPRHLVFHPTLPRFYLIGELDAKVYVCEWQDGDLREIFSHDSLPHEFSCVPSGAAIKFHPSDRTLIVSNRNSNTLTFFSVDACGDLICEACVHSGGKTPRDFAISPSGRWLLAVNQDSHIVMPVQLDLVSGLPTGITGEAFACGSPVCALF